MWKNILRFFLAAILSSIVITAISVYVLHDVDSDLRSNLGRAYSETETEFVLFSTIAAIIFGGVGAAGKALLGLQLQPTASKLSVWLGGGLMVVQYLWDLLSRAFLSVTAGERMLTIYMFGAPVVCALLLLILKKKQPASDAGAHIPGAS